MVTAKPTGPMAANKYHVVKCSSPAQHGPNVSHAVVPRKAVSCIRTDYHTITREGALSARDMMNNPIDVAAILAGEGNTSDVEGE